MEAIIVILLSCYLVIFPLGQLTHLPLGIPGINLYLNDLLISGLVVGWLGLKLIQRKKLVTPPLTKPIFLFAFFTILSLAVNIPLLGSRETGVASLYLIRWLVYSGVYFIIHDLINNPEIKISNIKHQISNTLIGIGAMSAIFGLLQYIFLPDTRFLENFGWDPHYYRALGTFLDPGFLGIILVLTLILLTLGIWPMGKDKWWAIIWLVIYIALALTYSRASYLAYLGSMGVIAWWRRSPKFFLGILLVGIITILLLPRPGGEGVRLERESTIKFRIINWGQSLTIIKDYPLFGVGFNTYRYVQRRYGFLNEENYQVSHAGGGADSSLLFVLATTGVLGFSAYLWLWIRIIKFTIYNLPASLASLRSGPAGGQFTIQIAVLASVVALLIHSLFLNSLFYPWVMGWFWILLGTEQLKEKSSL